MSNPYDFVQAPNIAGAGNYAQMLQQGLSNLGKPAQQQKPPANNPNQPQTNNVFNQPQQNGQVPAQNNYIGQLLKGLFGQSNTSGS